MNNNKTDKTERHVITCSDEHGEYKRYIDEATGACTAKRFEPASDPYPNHRRCMDCDTLVHKSNVKRHECWNAYRLSQQFPKSPTLHLRH